MQSRRGRDVVRSIHHWKWGVEAGTLAAANSITTAASPPIIIVEPARSHQLAALDLPRKNWQESACALLPASQAERVVAYPVSRDWLSTDKVSFVPQILQKSTLFLWRVRFQPTLLSTSTILLSPLFLERTNIQQHRLNGYVCFLVYRLSSNLAASNDDIPEEYLLTKRYWCMMALARFSCTAL